MKLIVQIPCYNEEQTLAEVVKSIPRKIDGIDQIEILISDDGSSDRTIEVARELEVDHIVRHIKNRGLAKNFETAIEACLRLGADIIVNTDGDNQYPQEAIPELIKPILDGEAEIVIADRQTDQIKHFSPTKKLLQKLGSAMVRYVSGSQVPDAVSGYRAYSRDAALNLNIVTNFSYVIETIVQASKKKIPMTSIPVITNSKTRESRLFKSVFQHVKKSGATTIRMFTVYEPFKSFSYLGGTAIIIGAILALRYLYFVILGSGEGHVQSLIFASIMLIIGTQIIVLGVLADLVGINRKLLEKLLYEWKKQNYR